MLETLTLLVDRLRQLDLLTNEQADSMHEHVRAESAADSASLCSSLAERLDGTGAVTEFQREQLTAENLDRLLVGDYLLIDEIDRGGMGQVYRARHALMGRDVAIKFTLAEDAAVRDRFLREVEAASKLTHAHIVGSLNAGMVADACYLVMEFVDGDNLSRTVRRQGPLDWPTALECVRQAALGLEYAHQQGVIHRDIKPSNLLRDQSGQVKILDMGLARLRVGARPQTDETTTLATQDHEKSLTTRGEVLGTVDYMAPEQAANASEATESADIYGLGCTLFYLITGQPPFYRPQAPLLERLLAHRDQPIPSVVEARPETPAILDDLLAKMLAKQPEQRFQSMSELLAAIDQIQRGESLTVESGEQRHSSIGWWTAGAAAIAIAFFAWQSSQSKAPRIVDKPAQNSPDADTTKQNPNSPPTTNEASQGESAPPEINSPTQLLPLIDLKRDVVAGEGWQVNEQELLLPTAMPAKLAIRVVPPGSFRWRLTVERVTDGGPLLIGVNEAGRRFFCRMGVVKADGESLTSLGTRDGRIVLSNSGQLPLQTGTPVSLEVIVTPTTFQLLGPAGEVFRWEGDFASLDLGAGWGMGAETCLMVGGNTAQFRLSEMILEPLPEGEL